MASKRAAPTCTISKFTLLKSAASGLEADDIQQLGFKSYSTEESAALHLRRPGAGFLIPYFDVTGKPCPMFRYRYEITEVASGFLKGAKLNKYDQPANTPPEIYIPHLKGVNWQTVFAEKDTPLFITEGELKAACATKLGFLTIGVGGVFSFGSKRLHQDFLPSLETIVWRDRSVYIVYDSDAAKNPDVVLAENRLARRLVDRGAFVFIVRLPMAGTAKQGLDDYLMAEGVEAFEELVGSTDEWADCEELHRLNEEAVFIAAPTMVARLPCSSTDNQLLLTKVTDFTTIYATRKVIQKNPQTGAITYKSAPAEWLKWANRNEAAGVAYAPGAEVWVGKRLNMWTGWGCEPIAGDLAPWHTLMDNHFPEMAELKHWFHQWLAYPLQHPGAKLNVACVIWSMEQGNGKSSIGNTIKRIYGQNFGVVTKAELSSSFNSWIANKQFIMGEEITGGSGREAADLLKFLITGDEIQINEKNIPRYTIPNCANYYFTSNHRDAFFIDQSDRRFFIHELTAPKLSDAFWQEFMKWQNNGGPSALFDYLMTYDLTGFNPQAAAPHTSSRQDMVEANLSEHAAWCHSLREHPDNVLRMGVSTGPTPPGKGGAPSGIVLPFKLWSTEDLLNVYAPTDSKKRPVSAKAFSAALTQVGFKQVYHKQQIPMSDGTKKRLWAIRDSESMLELGPAALRDAYESERGMKVTPKFKGGKK